MNSIRRRSSTPSTTPRFSSKWLRERADRVHRICRGIELKVQRGGKVRPAARQAARRWRGRTFRCDPTRPFALSTMTVLRSYYSWRKNGRSIQAAALRYAPRTKPRPTPGQVCLFLDCCRNSTSMDEALEKAALPLKASRFLQWLPAAPRAAARRILAANRAHRAALRRFAAEAVKLERRQAP